MSTFKFACPHCAQRLRCDERHAGRQILCPKCQQAIQIPSPSAAALVVGAESPAQDSRATMAPQLTLPPVRASDLNG